MLTMTFLDHLQADVHVKHRLRADEMCGYGNETVERRQAAVDGVPAELCQSSMWNQAGQTPHVS